MHPAGGAGPHGGAPAAPHTGTTVVAVQFDGGVVLGADSRVSTGAYVSNRASDKITPLADAVFLLRSGSAADTQAVSDAVRLMAAQAEMELRRPPGVAAVAALVRAMNYENKHLVGAMIVAGWDAGGGGQVFGCPIGGTLARERWATDGSGSTYIWGLLEAEYRDGMARAEAEALVVEAVAAAAARDGSSGGLVRLVTVTAAGAERRVVLPDALPGAWDELPPPAAMTVV